MMSPISLPADLCGGERPKITGRARHKDGGQAYGAQGNACAVIGVSTDSSAPAIQRRASLTEREEGWDRTQG